MAFETLRILLIDSYDSFTYNLASLCRQSIPNCHIYIIKNDQFSLSTLLPCLDYFAAVIIGPGPGSPERSEEIGVIRDLWKVADEHLLPIFGVCLGLQSLGVEFGARLKRLNVVKHGQISHIHHEGAEIFKGVGEVDAVRYHSLHVELAVDGELEQLGWADDGEENGRVVMALKHKRRPFWAVQYHPESVRTEGGGRDVISNFWRLAMNWSKVHARQCRPWTATVQKTIGQPWPQLRTRPPKGPSICLTATLTTISTSILNLADLTTISICEKLGVFEESTPFVLLDSAVKPGRFTIIGALTPSSPKINYFIGDSFVSVTRETDPVHRSLGLNGIWSWLAAFMRGRKAQGGCPDIPFWGGLVGYLSYELGVQSLSVPRRSEGVKRNRHPDVNLVFVERSIVRDSVTGNVYIQSLIPDDDKWIQSTAMLLKSAVSSISVTPSLMKQRPIPTSPVTVTLPEKASYISRINSAKEHLLAGNSYELCVTAPTRIVRNKTPSSSPSSSWELYKTLRAKNPAPHSAYLRLHPSTLLSSSPERFLSYSRGPGTVCQLRPIKGTLRKGPGVTRAVAEEALAGNKKEIAENLMIVDLIRHDLHGVVGEDVQVTKFCGVEECETVWSLVSVIEGRLPTAIANNPGLDADGELGWEVLSRSLPPGSMTGAPKKRSVEILQTLEDCDRGIYAGVAGYWCVSGGGDWSVVIRSCFKYDDQYETRSDDNGVTTHTTDPTGKEEWVIGAGGAITALSNPEAEWDEMVVKLESALQAFEATATL